MQPDINTPQPQVNPGDTVPVHRLSLFPDVALLDRAGNISLDASGAGIASSPVVRVLDLSARVERFRSLAYKRGYTGGLHKAVGDADGNVVPDIVKAVANEGGPRVRVFGGKDASVLQNFFACEADFTVGPYLAVGMWAGTGGPM